MYGGSIRDFAFGMCHLPNEKWLSKEYMCIKPRGVIIGGKVQFTPGLHLNMKWIDLTTIYEAKTGLVNTILISSSTRG